MPVLKYLKRLVALALVLNAFSACHQVNGNGPIVNKTRDLYGFNTIVSNLPTPVYITEGKDYGVALEGQQNILDLVETKLEDNRLIIDIKNGYSISGGIHLIVRVKSPNIKGIISHGSGSIGVLNHFQCNNLSIKNSGSGNIEMEGFWAKQLSISLTGSGGITIRDGSADQASVMLTGSGYLMAPDLSSKTMALQLTGSGNATTGLCDTLNARIAGSGNITYRGRPQLTEHLTGSGKFIRVP